MLRRIILHLFSNKSSFVILVGLNLLGCAGTTTVQRQHHLLLTDSSMVSVCFIRPSEGFMGVSGKPIGIDLDGEKLLDLSIEQYTFLDLREGKYNMVVTSWTVEGPNNAMVETSRNFALELTGADFVYLLFTREKRNFWEMVSQSIAEQAATFTHKLVEQASTITIPIGERVTLQFSDSQLQHPSEDKPRPGIGYTVESVSRKTAIDVASELEPVEGAQASPLK